MRSAHIDCEAVDAHPAYLGLHFKRAAIGDEDVGVLADFQRPHAVFDADMSGGVDGDGLQGLEFIHAGFDRQPRAQGQVLLGDDRRVRDDAYPAAGPVKHPGRGPRFVAQLELAGISQTGADSQGKVLLCQFLGDQMAFGHMLQRELQLNSLAMRMAVKISSVS